jgi:hypothetical protein
VTGGFPPAEWATTTLSDCLIGCVVVARATGGFRSGFGENLS